jgi:hypothetical protein
MHEGALGRLLPYLAKEARSFDRLRAGYEAWQERSRFPSASSGQALAGLAPDSG